MDYLADDKHPHPSTPHPPASSRIGRLIIKGLSIALILFLLLFVTKHCLPLLRPLGISLLQRLWDVLRFIVITTAITFGILSTQRKTPERATSWKEDEDRYSSNPRSDAMFHEVDQFRGKYAEERRTNRSSAYARSTGNSSNLRVRLVGDSPELANDVAESPMEMRSAEPSMVEEDVFRPKKLVASAIEGETRISTLGSAGKINVHEKEEGKINTAESHGEGSTSEADLIFTADASGLTRSANNKVPLMKIDPRLTSVYEDHPVIGRRTSARFEGDDDNGRSRKRSSSVDRPIQQARGKILDTNAQAPETTLKVWKLAVETGAEARTKASDTAVKVSKPSIETRTEAKVAATNARSKAGTLNKLVLSSRHSRSALDLDQYNDADKIAKSSRRNTSLSYDFGDDYSPEWLYDDPPAPQPPPPPPAADSSDSESDDASAVAGTTSMPESTAQALSRSLLPWRSTPVDIAAPPSANASSVSHPSQAASVEEAASTSISPSPGELNRRADAFIARFHEQMRMQRVESLERHKRWLEKGRDMN